MKGKIGRTLFWFKDPNIELSFLANDFYGIATLLNRLLNQKYEGKQIKFLNIYFYTDEHYRKFPQIERRYTHFYNGHLQYNGFIDLIEFLQFSKKKRIEFIWQSAFSALQEAGRLTKNKSLLESSEYAYEKGIKLNFNPDYRLIEADIDLYNKKMKASIWVHFKDDGMYSTFALETENGVVYEQPIDATQKGIEFFLEMYKRIEVNGNSIIIKGHRDVEYLPLKIDLEKKKLF